ncbi:VanZ family protein [Paenibacillus sp. PK3_47]|uniref:VanZ family protein n=1 Tax=Paenibacillus sp. PK3_47 TaxID=2072642 RepID=UPI00201D90BC|nr:VanZ family protein [Paenibacillus sp. PK3_47]UQZ36236.1 VanZ family protein [Paenibacillus sp. PK3_47]
MKSSSAQTITTIILQALFALYVYAIFKIILFKFGHIDFAFLWQQLQRSPEQIAGRLAQANFVPLATILNTLDRMTVHSLINLTGNIALFIPNGIFLVLLSGSKKITGIGVLFKAFGLSLTLECAQVLFSIGTFDVDDLILNTSGALLGYGLFRLGYALKKNRPATQA